MLISNNYKKRLLLSLIVIPFISSMPMNAFADNNTDKKPLLSDKLNNKDKVNPKFSKNSIASTNDDVKKNDAKSAVKKDDKKAYPSLYLNEKQGKYIKMTDCINTKGINSGCTSSFKYNAKYPIVSSSLEIQNMIDDKLISHVWLWSFFEFVKNDNDSVVYFLDKKGNIFKHNYIDKTQLFKIISTAETQGVGITKLNHYYNYPLGFVVSFSTLLSLFFPFILTIWILLVLKRFLLTPAEIISAKGMPSFDDIAGNDYIKEELKVIAKVFKDGPEHPRYKLIPKGVLLLGPPGNGKTLMASALAHEINGGFLAVNGADFVEMFAGLGPRRVKATFKKAKSYGNCVIFIDEIDAIGKNRHLSGNDSASQEWVNTLNKLLECIDGISNKKENKNGFISKILFKVFPSIYKNRNHRVIVIGATNRGEILDPALTRSGRLEKSIYISLPDCKVREEIAKIHLRGENIDANFDYKAIAMATAGMSGSDIQFLCKETKVAQMNIIQREKDAGHDVPNAITIEAFNDALDLKLLGPKTGININSEVLKNIAIHEGGHAMMAIHEASTEFVRRITIEARGNTLGFVAMVPVKDSPLQTLKDIRGLLRIQVAGRVAEEIIFGADNVTTGAIGDIQQATELAKQMVMNYGLNEKVGMVKITNDFQHPISEEMRALIDKEVRDEIERAKSYTRSVLSRNKEGLINLMNSLLKVNTQTGFDVAKFIIEDDIGKNDTIGNEE